jgi:hypothetical protein
MAGLTQDCKTIQYGDPGLSQPTSFGIGASQTVYSGAVALVSGSGSTTVGYLKNAATAGSADLVAGIIGEPAGGTYVKTGPGIVAGSTDGSVWANVRTGAYMIQSGTGADLLSATTNGKTVYYGGESANGPIACATSASSTRPVLGLQLPQDPGMAASVSPGSNYFPIKLNVIGAP